MNEHNEDGVDRERESQFEGTQRLKNLVKRINRNLRFGKEMTTK